MGSQFSRWLLLGLFSLTTNAFKHELLTSSFHGPSPMTSQKKIRIRLFLIYLFVWSAFLAEPGVSHTSPNLLSKPRLHQGKSGLAGLSMAPLQTKHTRRALDVCCVKDHHSCRRIPRIVRCEITQEHQRSWQGRQPGRRDLEAIQILRQHGKQDLILFLILKYQTQCPEASGEGPNKVNKMTKEVEA